MINGYPEFPKTINPPRSVVPTRFDKVAKSETEGGYEQTRLKSSRAMHKYVLTWDALPQSQLNELRAFDKDRGYGSKPFYFTLPKSWNDLEPKFVRIDGEISFPKVGRRHHSITLILKEV